MKDLMELVDGCGVAKEANTEKVPEAIVTSKMLEELGFKAAAGKVARRLYPILKGAELAAGKYIEITPFKIQAYLDRKVAEYNAALPKRTESVWSGFGTGLLSSRLGSGGLNLTTSSNAVFTTTTTGSEWAQLLAEQQQRAGTIFSFDPSSQMAALQNTGNPASFRSYTAGGEFSAFEWLEVPVKHYGGIPPMNVLLKFKGEKAKNVFDSFTIASVNAVKDPLLLGRITGSDSRYFIAQWGDDVKLDDVI